MNTKKQKSNVKKETPNSKLQKSSVIFMQLGLILALLAVYVTLEHKSLVKYASNFIEDPINIDKTIDIPYNFKIIKPKTTIVRKVKTETKIVPKVTTKIKIVKNDYEVKKELKSKLFSQDNPIISKPSIDLSNIPDDNLIDEDPIPFIIIEEVPSFPSCTGTNKEKKVCFNKKMNKHINKYFDVDLVQELGFKPGKKRITVQFIINKNGDIENIKTNASHIRLKKEVERIIKKLPKMNPGKQRNKPVKVRFNLPIFVNIED